MVLLFWTATPLSPNYLLFGDFHLDGNTDPITERDAHLFGP